MIYEDYIIETSTKIFVEGMESHKSNSTEWLKLSILTAKKMGEVIKEEFGEEFFTNLDPDDIEEKLMEIRGTLAGINTVLEAIAAKIETMPSKTNPEDTGD